MCGKSAFGVRRWSSEIGDGGLEFGSTGAFGFAAEDDLDRGRVVSGRKDAFYVVEEGGREVDIVGFAGDLVVKMGMGREIGAVASGTALKVDGADEIALHEGFEAVVNRGERDGWHLMADAGVNFVGGGMVALFEENAENNFTLGGGAQTAVGQALGQRVGGKSGVGDHGND
jgi:hypothetical protein